MVEDCFVSKGRRESFQLSSILHQELSFSTPLEVLSWAEERLWKYSQGVEYRTGSYRISSIKVGS